ncbi:MULTISPECIES: NAD(P)/FAD-dependent oxidoreductase [Spirulina sp. CCY15215]|uniref:FAD-dependent oxidoreductase n=1 Tax=Spirulina sp. CCY15215 TaxID=2767591 RepID=UPI00195283C5|nr:NAD(P)/FAD-dependent oxidoreductase [Spirulina major]
MSGEYDLVIIGFTPEGIYTALNAVSLNARVALVSQNCQGENHALYRYSLREIGRHYEEGKKAAKVAISGQINEINLETEIARRESAIATIAEGDSPAILSAAGVDFIEGMGEFCRRPQLAFIVAGRKLRSRSYIVAMGTRPCLPELKSLQEVGYLTADLLWRSPTLQQLPQSLAILGNTSFALELAQSLVRLGKTITLAINTQILPQEEPEAARLIQAQLEGEGIELLNYSSVTQVKKIGAKKWLQIGDRAIETDEIIWAAGCQRNLEGLNLEAFGIDPVSPNINPKLQTCNSQIYICGSIEDELELSSRSQYESDIALHNALHFSTRKGDRDRLPHLVCTDPNLTRIGLTENQAQQKYGENKIVVYHRYFKQVSLALLREETTGFLKIILNRKGAILGATIVGSQATELINLLTLARQNQISIDRLAELYPISPSFSEIIWQTARDWQRDRLTKNSLQNYIRHLWLTL